MPGYEVWKFHGESSTKVIAEEEKDYDAGVDRMYKMLEAMQQRLLRILLQWRLKNSSSFSKLQKSCCMNIHK
jgi:hypothetical protein